MERSSGSVRPHGCRLMQASVRASKVRSISWGYGGPQDRPRALGASPSRSALAFSAAARHGIAAWPGSTCAWDRHRIKAHRGSGNDYVTLTGFIIENNKAGFLQRGWVSSTRSLMFASLFLSLFPSLNSLSLPPTSLTPCPPLLSLHFDFQSSSSARRVHTPPSPPPPRISLHQLPLAACCIGVGAGALAPSNGLAPGLGRPMCPLLWVPYLEHGVWPPQRCLYWRRPPAPRLGRPLCRAPHLLHAACLASFLLLHLSRWRRSLEQKIQEQPCRHAPANRLSAVQYPEPSFPHSGW
jgi:hypothetical protein